MSVADRIAAKNEVATASPANQLKTALDKYKPQFARALPQHMGVDRFLSVVDGAVSKNPDLLNCEPTSIIRSVAQAARMGLEIDISGHGYLVPYFDTKKNCKVCQFIPGWQGIVDLVNRSGRGVVKTGAVFVGDFFEYDLGLDAFLRHRNDGSEDPDKLLFTYAIGQIRGEQGWTPPPIIEVWKAEKVSMHLAHYNKVGKNHYALKDGNNWVQYSKKLPLLQVCKYMPKSAEISRAIEAANKADSGEPFTIDGDFAFVPDGAEPPAPPAQPAASATRKSAPAEAGEPQPTYAQITDRIKNSKSRDGADLILDGARHLPADQMADLVKMADAKFPRA